MLNMLHMDLRRMRGAQAFWVTLAIFCGIVLLLCVGLAITSNADLMTKFAAMGGTLTVDGETLSDPSMAQSELLAEAAEARAELTAMSKARFFYSLFCQGGGLSVFVAILTAIFVCEDFSSGFAKNVFSVRNRGVSYMLAKSLTLFCTTGVYIAICFVLAQVCFVVLGMPLIPSTVGEYAKYLLQAWVVVGVFAVQTAFFSVWLRSVGLGIVLSFVCGGGVVAMLLQSFTHLFGINLMPYLLFGCLTADGLTVRSILVCLGWSLFYLLVGTVALRRKDI